MSSARASAPGTGSPARAGCRHREKAPAPRSLNRRRNFCACATQAPGSIAPATSRSRNIGIEIVQARAQPLEMERGAFDHGDQIGGRTRLLRVGEFDDPVRLQRARDRIDGGNGARVRRSGRNSRRAVAMRSPSTPCFERWRQRAPPACRLAPGRPRLGRASRHRRAQDRRPIARTAPDDRDWRRTGMRRRATAGHRSA